jgi:hypothetical protein
MVSSLALVFVVFASVCAGATAVSGPISPQLECALCGLAVNEIEGLVQENKTSAQIIQAIEDEICSHLSGDLKAACDQIAQLAPVRPPFLQCFFVTFCACHRGQAD